MSTLATKASTILALGLPNLGRFLVYEIGVKLGFNLVRRIRAGIPAGVLEVRPGVAPPGPHLAVAALLLGQVRRPEPVLLGLVVAHLRRIAPTIQYAIAQDNNHGPPRVMILPNCRQDPGRHIR